MTIRSAAILVSTGFILLASVGSYLLGVPVDVLLVAAAFAVGVVLWVATRARPPEPR